MKTTILTKAICCFGVVILILLFSNCTKKKTVAPFEPVVYLMKDYFPLNYGNEWIWVVVSDSIPESFVDGDINLGEPFVDVNGNGIYDFGEEYEDLNSNSKHDGPNDPWTPGIPFVDRNSNGEFDPPNGKWDEGEFFVDLDSNGVWSWIQGPDTSRQKGVIINGTYISDDGSEVFIVHLTPVGAGGDFVMRYNHNGFSNDSLGLRWHSHTTGWVFAPEDDLKDRGPITITRASIHVGDSLINANTSDTSDIYIWISVFEGVENVTVPAGEFQDCLEFRSVASGWTGNMQEYNGTSYHWFAKNVGLVKLVKPAYGIYWQLDSAAVAGITYP